MNSKIKYLLVICLFFTASNSFAEDNLAEILRKSKWDGIIGTWVDAGTQGDALKTTFAWKLKNRVIENTTQQGKEKQDVSLIGVNAKTGLVFNMSASSDGSSSLGEWKFSNSGEASLGVAYTAGTGQEGLINIRYRFVNKDTMVMTIELPQPVTVQLIRVKDKSPDR
jgi:hypothetical protein